MTAVALISSAAACTSDTKDKPSSPANTPASGHTSSSGASPSAATAPSTSSGKSKGANSKSGGINKIVPSKKRSAKPPVPLTATADFGTGVTARLVHVNAVHGEANGPGEVAGPALRIDVMLMNGTGHVVDLTQALVTITDSTGTPGVQLTQSGSAPFHGSVKAHSSVRATYVFTLPTAHRDPVTVNFSYSSEEPVVLFVGNAR